MAFSQIHNQESNWNNSGLKTLLFAILTLTSLQSCDKVVDETTPTPTPTIPQASTEVFKQTYPDVNSFIFKPLEQDKTWETSFVTSAGKVSSLVDYRGEIVDLNELIGVSKSLPSSVKQHFLSNYPTSQITKVYDLMKSSTVTDGYKLEVQTSKSGTLNLYYDGNNNFVREENPSIDKVEAVTFTSTDQINFDSQISPVIKQFVSNNQLKSASVIIYNLANKAYKIVLNFREKLNGALQTSEVLLSDTGQILQWLSTIENEYAYKVLTRADLPTEILSYVKTNFPDWQFDYGVSETIFGNNKTNFVTVKVGQNDSYLIVDEAIKKDDLMLIRTQKLGENYLPEIIKTTLSSTFPNWTFLNANVVYEPYKQGVSQLVLSANHFLVEIKQGSERYAIRMGNDGKVIYKYKIL